MNLSTSTIDAFRKVFAQITKDVLVNIPPPPDVHYVHHIHGKAHHMTTHYNNDFHDFPLSAGQLPTYEYINGQLRLYMGSKWGIIDIKDVRMRAVENVQFSDPALKNKTTHKVAVKTWTNASDSPSTHDLKKSKTGVTRQVNTTAKDFSQKVSAKIKETVGGGIEGIAEAEVETEYGFETAFEEHFSTEKETSTTEEESESVIYHVDPWTKTTVLQEEGIADYEQTVTTKGILDCSFRFSSDGDFSGDMPSLEAFEQWVQGGTLDGARRYISDFFAQRHFADYKIDYTPLKVEIQETVSFRDTSYGNLTRTDSKLTPVPENPN